MPYSLISFTSVGFDLSRLAHGEHIAGVLQTALALDATSARALAAHHPGAARDVRWSHTMTAAKARSSSTSADIAALVGGESGGSSAATSLPDAMDVLKSLESSPIGNLAALDNLIRRDILRWSWTLEGDVGTQPDYVTRAADILVDSAAAGFAANDLSPELRRIMAAPFAAAKANWRSLGVPLPAVATPATVAEPLAELVSTGPERRAAWLRHGASTHRDVGVWSGAMNQACWAVHVTDRVVDAAAAQLALVRAFRSAGFSGPDAAAGLWNALSGAVQAMMVADVLGDEPATLLLAPWREVMGENSLPPL